MESVPSATLDGKRDQANARMEQALRSFSDPKSADWNRNRDHRVGQPFGLASL